MNYKGTTVKTDLTVEQIFTIHYFEYAIDFDFPGEFHNFYEAVYVDAGEVVLTADGKKYVMKQGDFFLHRPGEFHSIACNGSTANAIVLSFSSICEELLLVSGKVISCGEEERRMLSFIIEEGSFAFSDPLNDVYTKRLHHAKNAPFGASQSVKNLLELLLIHIIRREKSTVKRAPKSKNSILLQEICTYIDNNLTKQLCFDDLCREFSFSKTALKKLFREQMGCGAMDYYNKCRINEAKRLLREKKYSITEISDILQFSGIHYFSRKFKIATNMTPKEYQHSVNSMIKPFNN